MPQKTKNIAPIKARFKAHFAHFALGFALLGSPVTFVQAARAQTDSSKSQRTVEYQVVNSILRLRTHYRAGRLKLNSKASTVARQHAQAMKDLSFFSLTSPERGSLNTQLQYARISSRPLHTFIALGKNATEIFQKLKNIPALKDADANQIALGVVRGEHPQLGQVYWATVVLLDAIVSVESLPREVKRGQKITLPIEILGNYKNPRLPITSPAGQVNIVMPVRHVKNKFYFNVDFKQKGRYVLEVLVDAPGKGPRVASILPVYVDQDYPLNSQEQTTSNPALKNAQAAKKYLFQQLNASRQKAGVAPLSLDTLLSKSAFLHSQDMAVRKFFAHVNPDGLNPNARYQQMGGFGHVGENIVIGDSTEKAYRQLMASPGHRANILESATTHTGIGVFVKDNRYYVTQLFQRREPSHNLFALREQLQEWLDGYRADVDQNLLLQDTVLQSLSDAYAQGMARTDQLDYQGVKHLNQQYVARGGQYQKMTTLVLSARNFKDVVAKLKKHEQVLGFAGWDRYGLGVAQSNSVQQGENTLWLTLALAAE